MRRPGVSAAGARLLAGETVVDTASVEWPSVVAAPKQTDRVAALTGVGDPLQLDRTVSTWQTGEGEDFVATLARAVPLGGDSTGVLVDQGGGAEHVKRLHYLFVANGRKLVEAWKGWEGQGLTSSTVDTMDIDNDGRVEALYWRFSSDDGVVSNWSLAVQRWECRAGARRRSACRLGSETGGGCRAHVFDGGRGLEIPSTTTARACRRSS